MPFAKGNKRAGSRKGKPNKTTAAAREAFQLAFDGAGGVDGLTSWAKDNQGEFYKLYARLIPTELTGKDGAPLIPPIRINWGSSNG